LGREALPVQEGPVAAAQVLQQVSALLEQQPGMPPGDAGRFDLELHPRLAPDHQLGALQDIAFTLVWAFLKD
jgi:hypothetical protein